MPLPYFVPLADIRWGAVLIVAIFLGVIFDAKFADAQVETQEVGNALDFAHDIVPILRTHCVKCHGGDQAEGGFSVNSRESILASGNFSIEDNSHSRMAMLLTNANADEQMPPPPEQRLSNDELEKLLSWLKAGIPWEDGFTFAPERYEPPLFPRPIVLPPIRQGRIHPIDRLIDSYFARNEIQRPARVDERSFVRRVYYDLIGLPPTQDVIESFVSNPLPFQKKQQLLVVRLLQRDPDYADHWLTLFNDLLRNDYSGTGFITGGRKQITSWLYESLRNNKPFDEMARDLISPKSDDCRGYIDGIQWRGNVSAGQTVEIQFAQSVAQSFLGINLKCASCHDSFIDRWTLQEAYGLAAIYSQQPLMLHRCDMPTGEIARASWLFPEQGNIGNDLERDQRLVQLSELMTSHENSRFRKTIVNRIWYQLFGRGVVHPLDAMQTKPWDEDLLEYLAEYFWQQKHDLKSLLTHVATSEIYAAQSQITAPVRSAEEFIFAGPQLRRLSAEEILDSVWTITRNFPTSLDAPVIRSTASSEEINQAIVSGRWIWDDPSGKADAGTEVVFRTQYELAKAPKRAIALVACDDQFRLFVGGREVGTGSQWSKLHVFNITERLKKGKTEVIAICRNGGEEANAAGFFFESHIDLEEGHTVILATNDQWQCSKQIPGSREGYLQAAKGPWQSASIIQPLPVWEKAIGPQLQQRIAELTTGTMPPIRASLLKNTALMRSLGRPTRDQIVSMRPQELTTLEAIDLSNEATLAETFQAGGEYFVHQGLSSNELVKQIYWQVLGRGPSEQEKQIALSAWEEQPNAEQVADFLWSLCMLPEFWFVR
ncbi:MAG: DUF1549 domain-containing protein [Planctomycetales bacterium]|nr:DUF1549 domain-containing protein [Planctomycetales bacterium]